MNTYTTRKTWQIEFRYSKNFHTVVVPFFLCFSTSFRMLSKAGKRRKRRQVHSFSLISVKNDTAVCHWIYQA